MSDINLGIPGLADAKEIGSGGFATVYEAVQVDIGRLVAVKVLGAVDEKGRRRFNRERRTMAQTTGHGNIVTLLDSGFTDPGQRPYLVMEHMSGGSLQDHLDTSGPLSLAEAVEIVSAVGAGLAFAHSGGIVHKDIKPANILTGPTGAKLSDFGISSVRDASGTSQVAFSLAYTAPETFHASRGPDGRVPDPRNEGSDLYSLACTLYALVAGEPPFTAENQATLIHQIISETPPPTGYLALDAFISTALAKQPEARFLTTSEFLAALAEIDTPSGTAKAEATVVAPPPSTASTTATVEASSPAELHRAAPRRLIATLSQGSRYLPTDILDCAVAPDSSYIATVSTNGSVRLWDPTTGETIRTLKGHLMPAWGCAIALDGSYIVTTSSNKTARLWNPETGDTIRTLKGHRMPVRSCAIAPDGSYIVTTSQDKTARLWNPETGDTIRTLEGHRRSVWSCAVAPDGSYIVTTSDDKMARLWDPETGDTIRTLEGHSGATTGCAVAPDGSCIVTTSSDKTVRLWDPETGDTIRTLEGHSGATTGCAVAPDGSYIVTTSSDKMVRLWDPETGDTIRTLEGHRGPVNNCAIAPDGSLIASVSNDSTVRVWG